MSFLLQRFLPIPRASGTQGDATTKTPQMPLPFQAYILNPDLLFAEGPRLPSAQPNSHTAKRLLVFSSCLHDAFEGEADALHAIEQQPLHSLDAPSFGSPG